jgi:hypothetical protein
MRLTKILALHKRLMRLHAQITTTPEQRCAEARRTGQLGGRSKSRAKIEAARRNGCLGGRPPKVRQATPQETTFPDD